MLTFIMIILFPLIIYGVITLNLSKRLIEMEVSNSNHKELVQIGEKINLILGQIHSVSNLYYLDSVLERIMFSYNDKDSYEYSINKSQVDEMFVNYNQSIQKMEFLTFIIAYNDKNFCNNNYNHLISASKMINQPWYQDTIVNDGKIVWATDDFLDRNFLVKHSPYIYAIRQLKNFTTWENTGILILGFSESDLRNMYLNAIAPYQSIFIIDQENRVVSSVDNAGIGVYSDIPAQQRIENSPSGYYKTQIGREDYLVTYYALANMNWRIVSFTKSNIILRGLNQIQNVSFILLFLYLLLAFILSYFISKDLTLPIRELFNKMESVKSGNFNVNVRVKSNDEIADLSEQFNSMIGRIKQLMDNIISEQQLKRNAEIQSLQAQVNPHFLYNTLASIRYMVYTENKEKADFILLSLVKLLKGTLSNMDEWITIDKEVECLKNYINIQQLVFESPIQVIINVDDNIKRCMILKLLLQPIVENAILHGLKPKKTGGMLVIQGYQVGEDMEFKIIDNGIGMNMTALQFEIHEEKGLHYNGIGIKNVHDRIVLHFGKDYGLAYSSNINKGTEVTVRLPLIPAKDGDYIEYECHDRG